jgi:transcriptional regulator with XRE-family HTH domain
MCMDESTIESRMRDFGTLACGSLKEFAEALQMKPPALQSYLSGRSKPGYPIMQRLHLLGCNLNWLISGNGSMTNDTQEGKALLKKLRSPSYAPPKQLKATELS